MFLLDTNVLSELRKGDRTHHGVSVWFASVEETSLYLSVLVIGEIHRGIASVERRDPVAAVQLRAWVKRVLTLHRRRILPVTRRVAEVWGMLSVPDPVAPIDGLLAATALAHDLVLVTRNVRDVERTGVKLLNPFG
jgi:predicted nucleic acid-binding protein